MGWLDFFLYHEIEIEIVQSVALDRQSLNLGGNVAALAELVDRTLNANLVPCKQLVARLLEGERTVFLDLLKTWWRTLDLAFKIAKEQLVRSINALGNILSCL